MRDDWRTWGRHDQFAPEGDWRTWLFLGGRGSGKTRAGAEWIAECVRLRKAKRIALIAPTFHDVREVMIEGPSGLRGIPGVRPIYEPSRRRLVWPNGAQAYAFSAEDPESLRGPQFDAAWADEMCFWADPERTLATLRHGLRLGKRPLLLITTTPRPIRALRRLLEAPSVVTRTSSTFENAENLAADFVASLREAWSGTVYERQELNGEVIIDPEGAMWKRADLEALRGSVETNFDRIVVAVDPPVSIGEGADACGIIAAGCKGEGVLRRVVVLADASVQGEPPQVWAARAADLARSLNAFEIIAESNNGGELVREVFKVAAPDLWVKLAHASVNKKARAWPMAIKYAQGVVRHAATFLDLEDEMCSYGAPDFTGSPDRLDALVWALTDLFKDSAPRARVM